MPHRQHRRPIPPRLPGLIHTNDPPRTGRLRRRHYWGPQAGPQPPAGVKKSLAPHAHREHSTTATPKRDLRLGRFSVADLVHFWRAPKSVRSCRRARRVHGSLSAAVSAHLGRKKHAIGLLLLRGRRKLDAGGEGSFSRAPPTRVGSRPALKEEDQPAGLLARGSDVRGCAAPGAVRSPQVHSTSRQCACASRQWCSRLPRHGSHRGSG